MKNINPKSIAVAISALAFSVSSVAQLEEVLVTAQKREQSLQTVPIAISAVSGELLEQTGVNTITCLLYTSPSPRDLSTSRMPSSA